MNYDHWPHREKLTSLLLTCNFHYTNSVTRMPIVMDEIGHKKNRSRGLVQFKGGPRQNQTQS